MPPFYFHDVGSSLLSLLLSSFSDRLPISSSFTWYRGILPSSFFSNIFLSLLNLSNFLCLWSPFHRLQDDSSFYFCCLPPGKWGSSRGLYRLLGEKEWCLCSSWWSWILFPVMSWTALDGMFWGFCELRKTLGCLSADGWGCVPILLVVWHKMSSTGAAGSWVELGLGVEKDASRKAYAD